MATSYDRLNEKSSGDVEAGAREKPKQWPGPNKCTGAGQYEYQGFEEWTPEEQKQWEAGTLTAKWGVGQVSIRLPIRSPQQLIAIIYGYLPFIIPIWWFMWVVGTWSKCGSPRFFPAFGLCIAAGFALVNETVTKKLCRKFLSEEITNRPPEAVCKHPGMPSGHVMNAYTLMTWTLAEVLMDYEIHLDQFIILLLVMGPVPWARVYNKDHTVPQVVASMLAAVCMGLIATAIRFGNFPDQRGHMPWDWAGYHVDQLQVNPGESAEVVLGSPAWVPEHCGL
jgi:membrane-associated phospholipid phosphatase